MIPAYTAYPADAHHRNAEGRHMQRTARRGEHELTSEILHDGVMQRVATSSSSHQNHGIPEVTGVPSREPSLWRVPPSPSPVLGFTP